MIFILPALREGPLLVVYQAKRLQSSPEFQQKTKFIVTTHSRTISILLG